MLSHGRRVTGYFHDLSPKATATVSPNIRYTLILHSLQRRREFVIYYTTKLHSFACGRMRDSDLSYSRRRRHYHDRALSLFGLDAISSQQLADMIISIYDGQLYHIHFPIGISYYILASAASMITEISRHFHTHFAGNGAAASSIHDYTCHCRRHGSSLHGFNHAAATNSASWTQ